jgi:hypothetical protein
MRRSRLLLLGLMLTLVVHLTSPLATASRPVPLCVGCECTCLLNYNFCVSQCNGNSACKANCAAAFRSCASTCGE